MGKPDQKLSGVEISELGPFDKLSGVTTTNNNTHVYKIVVALSYEIIKVSILEVIRQVFDEAEVEAEEVETLVKVIEALQDKLQGMRVNVLKSEEALSNTAPVWIAAQPR